MPLEVDARGLPCPQPVIRTRNAMREADEVITLVSAEDQVANVRRLAEKAGWHVEVEPRGEAFAIRMVKPQAAPKPQPAPEAPTPSLLLKRVVVISSDRMGRGEDDLGAILMRSFLYALGEVEPVPQTMIFFNTGVKLTTEGSPVLEELAALQARGVEILVCGTCLDYFGLKERVQVGTISNMYTIAETLLSASNTITV
ncbi:MAG: sulfurtransferase-like selenium metabolism protein YedF [Chloroflexi bacterium]|nr:sulfurtransferase-like selenium metabolism protein YedF [Chloroflexota bacterium]